MGSSGHVVDSATQQWVRATGRLIDLGAHPWLAGPSGDPAGISDEWVTREAARLGGRAENGGGLLGSMDVLRGAGFDPDQLAGEVREFYEQTAGWRMDVWSQWSPPAWPFAWLLSTVFARRLQQLSLPLRPLETAHGMDSRVVQVIGGDGIVHGAAWIRTLRSTGAMVYSGWYGVAQLPGTARPSLRVMFPLPNGSVTVFLRPDVAEGGTLCLTSPVGEFGSDGAYLLVSRGDGASAWVRRVPLAEKFLVYVDDEGVLRTDHALDLWTIPVIRLHYRLSR